MYSVAENSTKDMMYVVSSYRSFVVAEFPLEDGDIVELHVKRL
jgi:hypothetical protein